MKIKKYIKLLEKLAAEHPNATVVYASDSEGNSFSDVVFEPSVGRYKDGEFDSDVVKPNAICLN
jgi:hypothetical protein